MSVSPVVLLLALLGPAEDAEYDGHLQRAEAAFSEGQFDDAAEALKAAYELSPQDDVLFNWANAERLAGRCDRAVELYDRYLGAAAEDVAQGDAVSKEYVAVAEQRRAECEEAIDAEPTPAAEPQRTPVQDPEPIPTVDRPPPPATQPDRAPASPWWRDRIGWSLTGVGLAVAGAGGGLLGAAFSREPDPNGGGLHADYIDSVDSASRLEIAGWSLLAVGSAAIISGVVRFAVVSRRRRSGGNNARFSPGFVVRF